MMTVYPFSLKSAVPDDQTVRQFFDVRAHFFQFFGHNPDPVRFLNPGLRHIEQLCFSFCQAAHNGKGGQGIGSGVDVQLCSLKRTAFDADGIEIPYPKRDIYVHQIKS